MANKEWLALFPSAQIDFLPFERSDHRPLITNVCNMVEQRRGCFRYNSRLYYIRLLARRSFIHGFKHKDYGQQEKNGGMEKTEQIECFSTDSYFKERAGSGTNTWNPKHLRDSRDQKRVEPSL